MLTRSTHHIRPVIAALLVFCGLFSAQASHAAAWSACFSFLNAQDYPRAESEAQAMLKRKNLSREDQLYTWLCLGRAKKNQGRIQDALPAFQQVERLSQTTEELALAYTWLGLTYDGLDDLDRAELYDQRALKAFRELGSKSSEATVLNNLASVAGKRGDSDRELAFLKEALAAEPDESKKSQMLVNIAMTPSLDYVQAVSMLRQALDIDRRNGDGHRAAKHQLNLGSFLYHAEKYDEAEKELTGGISAIRLIGDKAWEAVGSKYMAWLEEARGNKAKAKQWYGKAESLHREIGDTTSADQMRSEAAALGR